MSGGLANTTRVFIADALNPKRWLEFDNIFRAFLGIDTAHHMIHEERSFKACVRGVGTSVILAFKTGNDLRLAHMLITLVAEDATLLELIEAPTWDNGTGVAHPILNRYRPSIITSLFEQDASGSFVPGGTLLNPTNLAGGTVIDEIETWSGKQQTFKSRSNSELVLKPNTLYAARATALAIKGLHINLGWYEKLPE